MKKMVFISLLQTCMIAGLPRSPVEGVQQVPEDEAKNHIESGMAELADVAEGDDDDDGDGLDKKTVPQLKAVAGKEKIEFASNVDKDTLLAAIRDGRERTGFKGELDALDKPALIERATADKVEFAADADEAAIRGAIFAKRYPPTA